MLLGLRRNSKISTVSVTLFFNRSCTRLQVRSEKCSGQAFIRVASVYVILYDIMKNFNIDCAVMLIMNGQHRPLSANIGRARQTERIGGNEETVASMLCLFFFTRRRNEASVRFVTSNRFHLSCSSVI